MLKRFQVLLQGENFRLIFDGHPCTVGFWTTRYVDATDVKEAETKAITKVLNETKIRARLNTVDDQPTLKAVKVTQTRWFQGRLRPPKGYTFYMTQEPETQVNA
jgi:hypothetical protein